MRTEDAGYCIKTDEPRLEWFERTRERLETRVQLAAGSGEPLSEILERNGWSIVRCRVYLEEVVLVLPDLIP